MTETTNLLPGSAQRLNYLESCRLLQQIGWLETTDIPPLPVRMPSCDDHAPLGVSLFRLGVWDDEWTNLTLPRTFIGRSEVSRFSFRNTDFSESRFCWNDFEDVDFTDADLRDCDLRCSLFRSVKFIRANLIGADLRLSDYTKCDFSGASLKGAKLTLAQGQTLSLTEKQHAEVDWQDEDGEEPGGG